MIPRILARLGVVAAVIGWFILLRPVALGGPASYEVVVGTSMEPKLHTGDLVIAVAQASYAMGDVVVYRVPAGQPVAGSLIVHRIVGGNGSSGFIVQGDNKPAPDRWRPRSGDIIGKAWLELPGSGRLLLLLRQPLVLSALLGVLAGLAVLFSGSSDPTGRSRSGRWPGFRSRGRTGAEAPAER